MKEFTPSLERYLSVRALTEKLCKPLEIEDFSIQVNTDQSPPKWHLGHTSWFFENFILAPYFPGYRIFDNDFNFIFNSYYESAGKRILKSTRGNLSRPTTDRIYQYRKYVNHYIEKAIEQNYLDNQNIGFLIELGLHHEQQHQELLLADIKYIFGNNPLFPVYNEIYTFQKSTTSNELKMLQIDEGIYEIGSDADEFFFDNERPKHKVFLEAFKIADRLITNAEFIQFIESGAYNDFNLWLSEGWDWLKSNKIIAPMYWHRVNGEWMNYSLNGFKAIEQHEPVTHISYFEAEAFARWAGMRLPTEFEWETAARKFAAEIPEEANFLESENYHPIVKNGSNNQFFGDVWEWTGSSYLAYPNYKKDSGALGEYNGKFMINQMVLRGGSCATPISHIRHSYRNFFHTNKRWQFTGVRLATGK